MKIIKELLPDVFLISLKSSVDARGNFVKTFNVKDFSNLELDFNPEEAYLSSSSSKVLRGMHYQIGKYSHKKLVTCFKGKVLDVIVDVRPSSKNYNKPVSACLNETTPEAILIGKGYAHGFLSLSEISIMSYITTSIHVPEFDCGVLWSSINFNWPIRKPITSQRDTLHPKIGKHKCEFS
mgnify:FL=1